MSTSPSSSYDHLPTPPSTSPSSLESSSLNLLDDSSNDDNDSLPSSSSQSSDDLDLDLDSDTELGIETDAEREWKESLQQLELLLTMVLVPFAGKYLGRKCAYWGELIPGGGGFLHLRM